MPLRIDETFLQFKYETDTQAYDEKRYFEDEGNQKFDETSNRQMIIMMNRLSYELGLDTYALKRLEVMLHEDLPFFAVNRRLVLNWASENFLY
ncbi:MAG: hypothetical protein PHN18_06550 [Sulfurospirillaceae bacterium]|jgi:hypothetical protein|nr:hypothetical protein [Sulfurospirillaceae bacterium]MDD2825975.1 hypothetical protein [Sulfurospirillaceae bacterium]